MQRIGRGIGNRTSLKASGDSFESGIGDEVELRGDMIGSNIADKPNGRGMSRRKTEELTATGAGLPLGNFLAVLEARIQDINGTPKNASAAEIVAAGPGTTENLDRGEPVGFGDMIVKPGSVRKGKRP
jgi:hypothetical protein